MSHEAYHRGYAPDPFNTADVKNAEDALIHHDRLPPAAARTPAEATTACCFRASKPPSLNESQSPAPIRSPGRKAPDTPSAPLNFWPPKPEAPSTPTPTQYAGGSRTTETTPTPST